MGGKIPDQRVMAFKEPALYTAEGLHTMIKLYENLLDADEKVKVGFRVTGTKGRMLVSDSGPLRMQYVAMIPTITFEKTRSLADWRAGLVDNSLEIASFILERFNWEAPNLGACKDAIEKMFSRRL